MKKFFLLPAVLLLFSCSSQKKTDFTTASVSSSNCPKDGECTVRLEKNQRLDIKRDEYGSLYYNMVPSDEKNVIVYEFSRGFDEQLQDSGYREHIIIETDIANPEMSLSNFTLEHANVLFGRFCYCKGATGNFKIKEGTLDIKRDGDELLVTMNFKVSEVPQEITMIKVSVK